MASKSISDIGASAAQYRIDRTPLQIEVLIPSSDGDTERVLLTAADVIAATTAGERASLASIFDGKLYPAALAKAGFEE